MIAETEESLLQFVGRSSRRGPILLMFFLPVQECINSVTGKEPALALKLLPIAEAQGLFIKICYFSISAKPAAARAPRPRTDANSTGSSAKPLGGVGRPEEPDGAANPTALPMSPSRDLAGSLPACLQPPEEARPAGNRGLTAALPAVVGGIACPAATTLTAKDLQLPKRPDCEAPRLVWRKRNGTWLPLPQ